MQNHLAIKRLLAEVKNGTLSRRDFLKYSTFFGLSTALAGHIVGMPAPRNAHAGNIQRGGTLKISSDVIKIDNPFRISWIAPLNQVRQIAEYLALTDEKNVTQPYLLKNWEPSEDLKTWTLNLRERIKFNNGDPFTADDVVFSINQWIDKKADSYFSQVMKHYLSPTGIEKTNSFQIKLHLNRPQIAVPQHLSHCQALILNHRTFEGDFIKRPHGTGPYTLDLFLEGDRCILKKRPDYWQTGENNQPLPYMDSIQFIETGWELDSQINALKSGEIDLIDTSDSGGLEIYHECKNTSGLNILKTPAARAHVLRMRANLKPWSDNRVRTALKMCQNRERILKEAYSGIGIIGQDFHVHPSHPEYCDQPVPKYDPQGAKELLKEAGYPNGIDVTLTIGNNSKEMLRYAEILKQDAAKAGFKMTIESILGKDYWEKWKKLGLGITPWMAHRPIGTMVLTEAYAGNDSGKSLPFNETNWNDKEFNVLIHKATLKIDAKERRQIFCRLEEIQMERGTIGIPCWQDSFMITQKSVKGLMPHPNQYIDLKNVWIEKL
jgi:peptide/nickel transport system substrate-binding protein